MILRPDVFDRLCRARVALTEEPEVAPTVEEVARSAGISPFHFIRQFESVFGSTPHQLRIQSRLDRARRLLAAGGLSVTDVCMEVGFSSLGTFSRTFRDIVGETPSEFRTRGPIPAVPSCFVKAWTRPSSFGEAS